jgi:hypothetical protein
MKLAVIISMHNEIDIVLKSIKNIKLNFPDSEIIVVHSEAELNNPLLQEIKSQSKYILLSNFKNRFDAWAVPAISLSRNFSTAFKELYSMNKEFDCIVVLAGDTLVTDSLNFKRRYEEMIKNNWSIMVSQAIGSKFFSKDQFPPFMDGANRLQTTDSTDIMPQFFLINGNNQIIKETKPFSDIEVTNKYASEQCLGDELLKMFNGDIKLFKKNVGILCLDAYSYNDGIVFQAGGWPERR